MEPLFLCHARLSFLLHLLQTIARMKCARCTIRTSWNVTAQALASKHSSAESVTSMLITGRFHQIIWSSVAVTHRSSWTCPVVCGRQIFRRYVLVAKRICWNHYQCRPNWSILRRAFYLIEHRNQRVGCGKLVKHGVLLACYNVCSWTRYKDCLLRLATC